MGWKHLPVEAEPLQFTQSDRAAGQRAEIGDLPLDNLNGPRPVTFTAKARTLHAEPDQRRAARKRSITRHRQ